MGCCTRLQSCGAQYFLSIQLTEWNGRSNFTVVMNLGSQNVKRRTSKRLVEWKEQFYCCDEFRELECKTQNLKKVSLKPTQSWRGMAAFSLNICFVFAPFFFFFLVITQGTFPKEELFGLASSQENLWVSLVNPFTFQMLLLVQKNIIGSHLFRF